ncbi:MAG: hypothetical protein KDA45_09460 [Planctomycetales bacterium]|nr:hypothetical protein [Planctomycetales bacterium]
MKSNCTTTSCDHCGGPQDGEASLELAAQTPSDELAEESAGAVMLLSMQAVHCRGGSSDFTLLPWAIIERFAGPPSFPEPPARPFAVENEWLPSIPAVVDDPPPRQVRRCA